MVQHCINYNNISLTHELQTDIVVLVYLRPMYMCNDFLLNTLKVTYLI